MWHWFVTTLREYPELGIFLALGLGYLIGAVTFGRFSLGPVTGTLIAAVIVGQLHLEIASVVKAVFFLFFIFAIGYTVGPQFINGFGAMGIPQMLFALVQCVLCLACAFAAAKIGSLDVGYAVGLFAGASTISAALGVATDALGQAGLTPDQVTTYTNQMPIAYAVTYIFGTIGSAWVLAFIMPRLLTRNLQQDAADLEKKYHVPVTLPENVTPAWRLFELRAFRVPVGGALVGMRVDDAERLLPDQRMFAERIRRDGALLDVAPDTVLKAGDIVAVGGHRDDVAEHLSNAHFEEVDDHALLDLPVETLDVVVTHKVAIGATIIDLTADHRARGVYLKKITRGNIDIPILGGTVIHRGDVLTLTGRRRHVDDAAAALGYADRPTEKTDMVFVGFGVFLGGLLGALVWKVGSVPLTLSTTGGALIGGIVLGWLRSVRPLFGRIPRGALWFMNSVGLNVFIAVIGISAGPGFVDGLKQTGASLFLWGVVVTCVPLILGALIGRYVFRFNPVIALGASAGARTTTASLNVVQDVAKSQTPALGYTVTYAVGNTVLTIWAWSSSFYSPKYSPLWRVRL